MRAQPPEQPLKPTEPAPFDGNSTIQFQQKMSRAPVWFCSMMAGNNRERRRLRDELVMIKGAWPLLMKQRNGGKWTPEDKDELKRRIEQAARYAPLEQLALSPQCGFSSTVHGNNIAVEDQRSKLRLVIDTAREVWGDA